MGHEGSNVKCEKTITSEQLFLSLRLMLSVANNFGQDNDKFMRATEQHSFSFGGNWYLQICLERIHYCKKIGKFFTMTR
jgi:hypothetical protein